MADRYWVGGTAAWDGTAGTKWALTSGGTGGQAVPTSSDNVFFNAASGAVTVTISAPAVCNNLTFTGFTGTFAGSSSSALTASGNVTFASGMTVTYSGSLTMIGAGTVLTTANKVISGDLILNAPSAGIIDLADALSLSGTLLVTQATFRTNNFNVTAQSLLSSNSNTRTISLGSSTVTLSSATPISFDQPANLTFTAGTSTIVCSSGTLNFFGGSKTFYNVTFSSTSVGVKTIYSGGLGNTFNNLTVTNPSSSGISELRILSLGTINGTLTINAGATPACRTLVGESSITCAAVVATDADFSRVTVLGAAVPVSGTRLGDCKGNSGITFPSAKTVYWRGTTNSTWGTTLMWSDTNGGTASDIWFPLAQDTAVFPTNFPNASVTVTLNANYSIGTIDMSARTANTMTLATGTQTPLIYGNWINGTGTTLTGTGALTFAGRNSQTITSAGSIFTQTFIVNSPGGSVSLLDSFICNSSASFTFTLTEGTFNLNTFTATLSSGSFYAGTGSQTRALAIGTGNLVIGGSSGFTAGSVAFTCTGTGTISLTSGSTKSFSGSNIQTYPTLNQGGTGTLNIFGSNKFKNITNTVVGPVQFTGGTTNEFDEFNLNGTSTADRLSIGSSNTTRVTLKKPTVWNVGAGSLDGGNNTGLSFVAGNNDFLNISYVNGAIANGGFFMFF